MKRYMLFSITTALLFGLASAATLWATPPSAEAVVRGNCSASKIHFAVETALDQTINFSSFDDLEGMSVSFSIPGTTNTCLMVAFTGEFNVGTDSEIAIRAVLDGKTVGTPSYASILQASFNESESSAARGFNFFFSGVTPGPHTVKVQWRSGFGNTVTVFRRSMVVFHK